MVVFGLYNVKVVEIKFSDFWGNFIFCEKSLNDVSLMPNHAFIIDSQL